MESSSKGEAAVSTTEWKSGMASAGEAVKASSSSSSSTAVKYSSQAQYSSSSSKEIKTSSTTTETVRRSIVEGGTTKRVTSGVQQQSIGASAGGSTSLASSSSQQSAASDLSSKGTIFVAGSAQQVTSSSARAEASSMSAKSSAMEASSSTSVQQSSGSTSKVTSSMGISRGSISTSSDNQKVIASGGSVRQMSSALSNQDQQNFDSRLEPGSSSHRKESLLQPERPSVDSSSSKQRVDTITATSSTGRPTAGHVHTHTCTDCIQWKPSLEAKTRASFDEDWKARLRSTSPPASRRTSVRDFEARKDSTSSSREPSPRKGSMRRKSSLDGSFRRDSSIRKSSKAAEQSAAASYDGDFRRESRNYKQLDEDWKSSLRGAEPLRSPSVIRRITQQTTEIGKRKDSGTGQKDENIRRKSSAVLKPSKAQGSADTEDESTRMVSIKHIGRLTDNTRRSSLTGNTGIESKGQTDTHGERRRSSFTVEQTQKEMSSKQGKEDSQTSFQTEHSQETTNKEGQKELSHRKSSGALETIASITKSAGKKLFGKKKSNEETKISEGTKAKKHESKKKDLSTTVKSGALSGVSKNKQQADESKRTQTGREQAGESQTSKTTERTTSRSSMSAVSKKHADNFENSTKNHVLLETNHAEGVQCSGKEAAEQQHLKKDDYSPNNGDKPRAATQRKLPKTPTDDGAKAAKETAAGTQIKVMHTTQDGNLLHATNNASVQETATDSFTSDSQNITTVIITDSAGSTKRSAASHQQSSTTEQNRLNATNGGLATTVTHSHTSEACDRRGSLRLLEPSVARSVKEEINMTTGTKTSSEFASSMIKQNIHADQHAKNLDEKLTTSEKTSREVLKDSSSAAQGEGTRTNSSSSSVVAGLVSRITSKALSEDSGQEPKTKVHVKQTSGDQSPTLHNRNSRVSNALSIESKVSVKKTNEQHVASAYAKKVTESQIREEELSDIKGGEGKTSLTGSTRNEVQHEGSTTKEKGGQHVQGHLSSNLQAEASVTVEKFTSSDTCGETTRSSNSSSAVAGLLSKLTSKAHSEDSAPEKKTKVHMKQTHGDHSPTLLNRNSNLSSSESKGSVKKTEGGCTTSVTTEEVSQSESRQEDGVDIKQFERKESLSKKTGVQQEEFRTGKGGKHQQDHQLSNIHRETSVSDELSQDSKTSRGQHVTSVIVEHSKDELTEQDPTVMGSKEASNLWNQSSAGHEDTGFQNHDRKSYVKGLKKAESSGIKKESKKGEARTSINTFDALSEKNVTRKSELQHGTKKASFSVIKKDKTLATDSENQSKKQDVKNQGKSSFTAQETSSITLTSSTVVQETALSLDHQENLLAENVERNRDIQEASCAGGTTAIIQDLEESSRPAAGKPSIPGKEPKQRPSDAKESEISWGEKTGKQSQTSSNGRRSSNVSQHNQSIAHVACTIQSEGIATESTVKEGHEASVARLEKEKISGDEMKSPTVTKKAQKGASKLTGKSKVKQEEGSPIETSTESNTKKKGFIASKLLSAALEVSTFSKTNSTEQGTKSTSRDQKVIAESTESTKRKVKAKSEKTTQDESRTTTTGVKKSSKGETKSASEEIHSKMKDETSSGASMTSVTKSEVKSNILKAGQKDDQEAAEIRVSSDKGTVASKQAASSKPQHQKRHSSSAAASQLLTAAMEISTKIEKQWKQKDSISGASPKEGSPKPASPSVKRKSEAQEACEHQQKGKEKTTASIQEVEKGSLLHVVRDEVKVSSSKSTQEADVSSTVKKSTNEVRKGSKVASAVEKTRETGKEVQQSSSTHSATAAESSNLQFSSSLKEGSPKPVSPKVKRKSDIQGTFGDQQKAQEKTCTSTMEGVEKVFPHAAKEEVKVSSVRSNQETDVNSTVKKTTKEGRKGSKVASTVEQTRVASKEEQQFSSTHSGSVKESSSLKSSSKHTTIASSTQEGSEATVNRSKQSRESGKRTQKMDGDGQTDLDWTASHAAKKSSGTAKTSNTKKGNKETNVETSSEVSRGSQKVVESGSSSKVENHHSVTSVESTVVETTEVVKSGMSSQHQGRVSVTELEKKKQSLTLPELVSHVEIRDEARPSWQRIIQPGSKSPTSPTRSPQHQPKMGHMMTTCSSSASTVSASEEHRTSVTSLQTDSTHQEVQQQTQKLEIPKPHSSELKSPSLALSLSTNATTTKTNLKKGVWEGEDEEELEVSLGSVTRSIIESQRHAQVGRKKAEETVSAEVRKTSTPTAEDGASQQERKQSRRHQSGATTGKTLRESEQASSSESTATSRTSPGRQTTTTTGSSHRQQGTSSTAQSSSSSRSSTTTVRSSIVEREEVSEESSSSDRHETGEHLVKISTSSRAGSLSSPSTKRRSSAATHQHQGSQQNSTSVSRNSVVEQTISGSTVSAGRSTRSGSASSPSPSPGASRKSVSSGVTSSDTRRESSATTASNQQQSFVRVCGCSRRHGSLSRAAGAMLNKEVGGDTTCDAESYDGEHASSCKYAFRSEWRGENTHVSTWDWLRDEPCYVISADNCTRRQRYVSGIVFRPRLAPIRWSNTLIWNIDSTRKRHRSVCVLQPATDAVRYFESVYSWTDCDDTDFPEVLASKGQEYFKSEKVFDLSGNYSPPASETGAGDVAPSSASSAADPGNDGGVKPGAEIKLGVIILDDHKNRS